MLYQLITLAVVLSPVLFLFEAQPSANDWKALIVLALLTTAIGHTYL